MGEALVAGLIGSADSLGDLPVRNPARPTVAMVLSDFVDCKVRPRALPNASLERSANSPRFDGQHQIDCALVRECEVVAMELKLGRTRLSPADFADRFVGNEVRLTHGNTALAGSMVALLDANGRGGAAVELKLRACDRPVRQEWLLVLLEDVWDAWTRVPDLLARLKTRQMAGVITLEDLVRHVGVERAREVGLGIAKASIDSWFEGLTL